MNEQKKRLLRILLVLTLLYLGFYYLTFGTHFMRAKRLVGVADTLIPIVESYEISHYDFNFDCHEYKLADSEQLTRVCQQNKQTAFIQRLEEIIKDNQISSIHIKDIEFDKADDVTHLSVAFGNNGHFFGIQLEYFLEIPSSRHCEESYYKLQNHWVFSVCSPL